LPEFFRNERHEGMQHPKDTIKNLQQGHLRQSFLIQVLVLIEKRLDQFKIPVAEFMPDELIKGMGGFIKFIIFT
jgi:hypothetical protein